MNASLYLLDNHHHRNAYSFHGLSIAKSNNDGCKLYITVIIDIIIQSKLFISALPFPKFTVPDFDYLREDSQLPSRGECTIFAVIVIYLREGSDNS